VRVERVARRLSVRVYPGGRVEVAVPPGASPAAVQKFIGTHRQWIHRRVEDLSTAAAIDNSRPASIKLPAIGQHYAVEYEHAAEDSARARVVGENLLVVSGPLHNDRAISARCAAGSPILRISSTAPSSRRSPRNAGSLRSRASSQATHPLGQLFCQRYDQPERVPAVPASGSRALSAGA
jgi:hypothetical protein